MKTITILLTASLVLASCTSSDQATKNNQKNKAMVSNRTKQYGYNRDFLQKYTKVIELKDTKSAITLVPAWQGRVMTSTAEGDSGFSFGWINRDLIASGKIQPHINAFGGEERIWLGPEGGQFSIFFSKGKSFVYDDWQTPAFLDTTPYEVISSSDTSALFASDIITENYSGILFKLRLEREVTLLTEKEIIKQTSVDVKGLNCVAYKSWNKIINKGDKEWKKETGLLSIWMLGMFNPSPSVVIIIPVKSGDENILGPKVNDNYFGEIPGDRLKVTVDHIFFKAAGKSKGKKGIVPLMAKGKMGSVD